MGAVSTTERSHYQVLGVSATASTVEIRRAHRQLAYLLHPDRQGDMTPAERSLAGRRMREVNAAWTTLSDPTRRAEYDRTLAGPATAAGGAAGGAAAGASGGEWWDSDDPEAAFARLQAVDDDLVDPQLSGPGFWFLRRVPVLLMLLVGLVIFVVSAYAGGGAGGGGTGGGAGDAPAKTAAPPVVPSSECLKLMPDHMAYGVSCDGGRYDATIVREAPDVRACQADGLSYAVVGAKSYCVQER